MTPARATSVLDRLGSRKASLFFILCGIFLGAVMALPGLNDAIWQDEAVTLLFHSSHGAVYPFLNYSSPNSHVVFSSMLAAWIQLFPDGMDLVSLRMLPLLLFLAAIPTTFLAASRLGGPVCAIAATGLFVCSSVTANFSTQLRGYGPSWLFVSNLFWASMNVLAPRAWRWRAAYAVSCALAVGVLPTNFFLGSAVGLATAAYLWLDPDNRTRAAWPGYCTLLLSPALGLLMYAAVWRELMQYGQIALSDWTRPELARHWIWASLSDFLILVPLLATALAAGLHSEIRSVRERTGAVSSTFLFAIMLLATPMVAIAAMPHAPFPRTVVPLLPVWFCSLGFLLAYGIDLVGRNRRLGLLVLGLGCALLLLHRGQSNGSCRLPIQPARHGNYDLCYQYFHDRYRPGQVVDVWQELGQKRLGIVSDYEGFYALRVLGSEADVQEYEHFQPADGQNPLIVAHDLAGFRLMAKVMGLDDADYRLIADTGYFKVFAKVR
jgi:hypothetical protein